MSRLSWIAIAAPAIAAGCLRHAPTTTSEDFSDPACAGTQAGAACLTLEFSASDSTRQSDPRRCSGYLHWALYHGGDVSLFGPGNNDPVKHGIVPNVDLSRPGASHAVTLANLDAESYQILGFLSQTTDSSAVSGDPVTFPSDSFPVPADRHTAAIVVFDFVR